MVEAQQNQVMTGSGTGSGVVLSDPQEALQKTALLVNNIDKRLSAAVSADELRKLTMDNARPEFKKVLQ